MRSLVISFLFSIAYLGMAQATGQPSATTTSTYSVSPTQTTLMLSLPSNPTTGYQWTAQAYDKTLFSLVTSQYIAPTTTRMGAAGVMVFKFSIKPDVARPATSQMKFIYQRPWETTAAKAQSATVQTVTIRFQ